MAVAQNDFCLLFPNYLYILTTHNPKNLHSYAQKGPEK